MSEEQFTFDFDSTNPCQLFSSCSSNDLPTTFTTVQLAICDFRCWICKLIAWLFKPAIVHSYTTTSNAATTQFNKDVSSNI